LQKNGKNQRIGAQIAGVMKCKYWQYKGYREKQSPLEEKLMGLSIWTFSFSDSLDIYISV